MTNAEKYLKDGASEYDFVNFIFNNAKLYFSKTDEKCYISSLELLHFLQAEGKLTLTEDEKVILRNIDKKIKYITRDKSGYLYITEQSFSMLALSFSIYNHLFQFIQPRRRI